jgi:uncharacterized protein YjbJ (UPF0337 family)
MADETSGKTRHVKGKIKEGIGELLGDSKLEREGRLSQVEGRAEQDASRAEAELNEAAARKAAAETARKRSERSS